jgi:hypothetical protein
LEAQTNMTLNRKLSRERTQNLVNKLGQTPKICTSQAKTSLFNSKFKPWFNRFLKSQINVGISILRWRWWDLMKLKNLLSWTIWGSSYTFNKSSKCLIRCLHTI